MRIPEIDWQPVSRVQLVGWTVFYGLLLLYLSLNWGQLTLLELLVPALLAASFAYRRELPGTTFCLFAFFHSLTGVATYMADALRLELPLVTVGGGEAEHDWVRIFSSLG